MSSDNHCRNNYNDIYNSKYSNPDNNDHYVIIGNGPAGNHAASILRNEDHAAKITVISDECTPYYYKPRLTEFIQGKICIDDLMVNSLDYYKNMDIRIRLGQKVDRIDPDADTLFLTHMETIHYTKLIIAAGNRPRILPSMSRFADCLSFVSSYSDVVDIKDEIHRAERFFIFGGDFVGFKFIHMLASMGKKIYVMIYPEAFWPYQLTHAMVEKIVAGLSSLPSDVLDVSDIFVKDDISGIEKIHDGFRILTQKGAEKKADLIFSFNGMVPAIDFAEGCGLDTDHGILVDEYLKTNIDNIYACGSCAQVYNPAIKNYSVSIGWPNAVAQGEVAALNLLGDNKVIESVDKKYFDLEGIKIKTTWWDDINDDSPVRK